MKRLLVLILPVMLGFVSSGTVYNTWAVVADSTQLAPKEYYSDEAKLVVQLLDTYHFKRIKLDDSLSSVILDGFIETLDNNKSYYLSSDIEEFERYRYKIDDLVREGNLQFAYDIYLTFEKRFYERMAYVESNLLNLDFDYEKEEFYDIDRSEMDWPDSNDELNDLWRRIIKSQSLNLKLNGKEDADIADTIDKRYKRFQKSVSQYTSEDVFELFMNTLAESYDPHSNYFSPRTSDRFQQSMSLSLEGIGARLQTENDYTKVVQIIPGGPADKSKMIGEDDRIIGVAQGEDGEMVDVIGWRIDDVVDLIKGPKGTVVRLQILPAATGVDGPPEEITLTRDKIKLEDQKAQSSIINHTQNGRQYKLGVITLPSFYMDFEAYQRNEEDYTSTTRDVRNLIEELKEQNVDGLIMDLRDNGGGSLSEAIDLTGLFIKDGPVVQVRYPNDKVDLGADEDPEVIYNGPVSVLINRFSASASEIFAAAIQDYQRGIVIGEQSYGKGTVQSVIDLSRYIRVPEGEKVGQLKLTLQKFYRVTGSSTQHMGVMPDIDLPSAFDAEEFGESANASALAWDQIKPTRYSETTDVSDKMRSQLKTDYEARLDTDVELQNLVDEANELKNNINKTRVSLNYDVRKKEMEAAEKRRAERSSMKNTRIDVENQIIDEIEDIKDKYLRESVIIMSDYIAMIG